VNPMPDPHPARALPSVSAVLAHPLLDEFRTLPHDRIVEAIRYLLDATRNALPEQPPSLDEIAERVRKILMAALMPNLQVVINATGIVLHTNLGRAPMAEIAALAAAEAARNYCNLELDLATGKRSKRQDLVRGLLCKLTGGESATVVNNCAAATVIVLRALAAGREVIVSRGQLVEIGGSFRIPEIMAVSGAILKEVGTTNITRIGDYRKAVSPLTAALMRVHSSNFIQRGFTQEATIQELAALGSELGIPTIDDVGSGAVDDFAKYGLANEPNVRDGLKAGADLVLFSGDKLLGGPQAGIIAGKKKWIDAIEADPLMRAFRCDKMTLAALEETLRLRLDPVRAADRLPLLRMIAMTRSELRTRCERFLEGLGPLPGASWTIADDIGYVGGGSLPEQALPTVVLRLRHESMGEARIAEQLRIGTLPVLIRVNAGDAVIDLRTVLPRQESALAIAIRQVLSELETSCDFNESRTK